MQRNSNSMMIMAQELCRAMGIDVPSLIQTLQDQGFNSASSHPVSNTLSELDMDDEH
jgi:hypothetical protein